MTRLLPIILLRLPTLALAADVKPGKTRVNNRCTSYAMCAAQSGTGECVSGSDEIVQHVGFMANYTFYSTRSTSTDYICNIFTNDEGYLGGTPASDQVNTASITDEVPVYTMRVLLRHFWIACSTNTGGVINIDVLICGVP